MPSNDLAWAQKQYKLNPRREGYDLYWRYYHGDQRLAYATDKFREAFGNLFKEFAENACAGVVDSLAARLKVTGWASSRAESKIEDVASPLPSAPTFQKVTVVDPLGEAAQQLWDRNRMDERMLDVHTEALRMGDSYVIVWPDEDMMPGIWPNDAHCMAVQYDPNRQKELLRGSKIWYDDVEERWYLNVFLREAIEKYGSKKKDFPQNENGWESKIIVPNPYKRVPVFHFPNQATNKYGESEQRDVVPLQDGLNKSVMDMMIAMEFASYKQRYVIGMEVDVDEVSGEPVQQSARQHGADRMMTIADPDAKVGQFDATDLDQFLRVTDKFWASVARVSGTPLHYFYITSGDFPSGEAIKSAEARFVNRIEERQKNFSPIWGDVMLFALDINGELADVPVEPLTGRKDYESLTLVPVWKDASPRTESELADTAVKKQAVGVSRSQVLKELGYDDETIARMLQEADAREIAKAQLAAQQTPPGTNPNGQPTPPAPGTKGVKK